MNWGYVLLIVVMIGLFDLGFAVGYNIRIGESE